MNTTKNGMRLLLVQPTGDKYGHFGIYICRLAQELSLRGNKVTICTNVIDAKRYVESPKFEVIEVRQGLFEFESFDREAKSRPMRYWYGYFRNSLFITFAAIRLAKRHKYDGIYFTDVEFLVASLLLKFFPIPPVPLIMQVNASNFSYAEYPGSRMMKFYKVIQREAFRLAIGKEISAFSVLGEWHLPRLASQLRLPSKFPVEIIPDGGSGYTAPISREIARRDLGINWPGDIFLFMGIMRRDKGLEELSIALRSLWNKRKDFRIILSGFPFEYHHYEIESLFAYNSEDNPIIYQQLEYISEDLVPSFFYASDSLLLPYNNSYKGSSGPLMKGACTFGLPVIVSDVSEMGRLVKKFDLGFVSRPGDAVSLEDAMNCFLETSDNIRNEISKRAFCLGETNSWPEMAHRYENVFKSLIQKI